MKHLHRYFIIFIFLLGLSNFALSQGAMSGNGLLVASAFNESGKNYIYVHKFMTKELIRKITISSNTSNIEEIQMSYSGKYLAIKESTKFTVIDVMQGATVTSVNGASQIVFPKNGDFFIALKGNVIARYDCTTGSIDKTYSYPSGKQVSKLEINTKDDYFAAISNDRIYIYEIEQTGIKKELLGWDIKFSKDGNFFTVISTVGEKMRVSTYKLPTYYQERAFSTDVLFQNISYGGELFPTRSSLSPNGKYAAIYTAKGTKVEIFIFSTSDGKKIWTINNFANTNNELYPQMWVDDETVIGMGDQLMGGEYNIYNKTSNALGLRIDDFTSSVNLSSANQLKNRIISPDAHFVVIQDGNNTIIRDSRIQNKKVTYTNVEFICFSPDSKFAFVKKDNTINAISTAQLTSSINANKQAQLYAFDRITKTQAEQIIASDATPPRGYAYFYVNNTKQIVKVDTAKLHYVFRSMKINGNQVEMQINLVDQNGNQFIGATDPSWSYIWCNLLVQNPNGTVSQVNNFSVTEVSETEPTAYALVLDHSGSMGTQRANQLQFGAWNLVNNKKDADAYMLIKYDNKVKLETQLTKDKYSIKNKLSNTGITGYGGSTSLIDAAYLAALKLSKANSYSKKVIILFTDGYENSSLFAKSDLLKIVKENNIQINIIGFGDQVNEQYLKSLAYTTGGTFVHLYKTNDLKNVFRDIDYKRRNYYTVKFNTQVYGKHVAFLQLCQDQLNHDSIWIPFDNTTINKPLDQQEPVLDLKTVNVQLTQFNKLKIPINPVLKPVTDKKITTEFKDIHFPNILFETSSAKIISSEKQGIDEIVAFMRKYPYVFLEIHGHTDNLGTPDFNRHLSMDRAEAAKKLIVDQGIAPGRVITKGFGDTKPVASNDTDQGRALNRRIEFHIFVQ